MERHGEECPTCNKLKQVICFPAKKQAQTRIKNSEYNTYVHGPTNTTRTDTIDFTQVFAINTCRTRPKHTQLE